MRKLIYLLLLPLAVAVTACGGKKGSSDNQSLLARIDSIDAHGLQRMQTSKSETNFKFKGKDYHSFVSRTPDEYDFRIRETQTYEILEDVARLRSEVGLLYRNPFNETVLNKTFTKNDFSSVVDAKFLSKSILEGIVYDKTTPQGIVYAASVCYPQTDLYMPLSITITADGKMSIQKVDILEEDYDDEAPN